MSRQISGASLGAVNYSKPHLLHSTSQQSIAASDDYYSFSDEYASTSSKATVFRYDTPSSRTRSPKSPPSPPSETPESEVTIQPQQENSTAMVSGRSTASETVRPPRSYDPRNPPLGAIEDRSVHDQGPPTPGVSDELHLRFAIDQLTRDEESPEPRRRPITYYGMGPMIPNECMDDDTTSLVAWEAESSVAEEENQGHYPNSDSNNTNSNPQRAESPKAELNVSSRSSTYSESPNVYVAAEASHDNPRYPPLDFLPMPLRRFTLIAAIVPLVAMIAALAFCNTWSQRHDGLWDYDGQGTSRYFVFQYLPQLLAAFLTIWLFIIQSAVYRITPFSIMASDSPLDGVLQNLSIIPKNFLLPDLSHFRNDEASIGVCLSIIWFTNLFSMPLQSCLFQVQYLVIAGEGSWRWVAVQAVAWTLIALYVLLVVALALLCFRFSRGKSGLMWDPVSLADIIPLIQRSNILRDFHRSETSQDVSRMIPPRNLRLGYWQTSKQREIFYGIGEMHEPLRGDSMEQRQIKAKKMESLASDDFDIEQQRLITDEAFREDIHSPSVRFRWTTWFLRESAVAAWVAIAIVLLIAVITVSFVKDAISHGFLPLISTVPSSNGFSSSNFLYSFIPSFIGTALFLMWQPIDVFFRVTQPFVNLSSPSGASAEDSLLLSYPSCLPFGATIVALSSGHYKLAWISFIGLASLAIPVLSGGVFSALYFIAEDEVRISAYMPAYYALLAFCGLFALSFLTIWPRRKRYLPHDISTIADLISFFYQSPLLSDGVLREPRNKADLVTRIIVVPPGETEKPRYAFGAYKGRDGREHLGIDRVQRPGQAEMLIVPQSMK